MTRLRRALAISIAALSAISVLSACSSEGSSKSALVIYSGRSEEFIAPFFAEFTASTGIKLDVRYGDSAALAAQILEEGENSPADLFISQDAGALGAVSAAGLLTQLDSTIVERVATNYRSTALDWVGLTGRARVFAYSPERVGELPRSVDDLILPKWRGRLAIAPTNSSFQAFVTAMVQLRGEVATESWLRAIVANSPKYYEKNSLIVAAIDSGEVDAGLTNHYYIWEVAQELGRPIKVANSFFSPGDVGNLINVSGAAILRTSSSQDRASELISYLLSLETQKRFVTETSEYSLVDPSLRPENMVSLSEIAAPDVDLARLADLESTQRILIRVGML